MPSEMRYENCVCVDASLVVKWLVSEPDSAQALDVLEEWMRREVKMIAPPLIDYEVGSVLRKLSARGRIDVDEARQRLHIFESLHIGHVHPPFLLRRAWEMAGFVVGLSIMSIQGRRGCLHLAGLRERRYNLTLSQGWGFRGLAATTHSRLCRA